MHLNGNMFSEYKRLTRIRQVSLGQAAFVRMAFLLLVLAMGAAADYYMPQVPPQDLPMPTIPPSTPYQTYQPQPVPTLPPQDQGCQCTPVQTNHFVALQHQASCLARGVDLDQFELVDALRTRTDDTAACKELVQCSDYATEGIWIGTKTNEFGCFPDSIMKHTVSCQNGNWIDQNGDNMIAYVCLRKKPEPTLPPTVAPDVPSPSPYEEYNYPTYAPQPTPTLPPPPPPTVAPDVPSPPPYQEYNYATYAPQPVPTLPPFVPDVRPCDVCPAVTINFNPALTRTANCRALGLDLADYEILSAMTVDTTTSTVCQKTIKCSEYASDTIWIGTHQGQFGCWHDNVRSYLTTCQDGKFIDQDGDHIVSLVCLKKVDRSTPSQAQPQPYYTAAPQPVPTLPPAIITPAPDVPKANGYSGY
ncbi:hypothetical protein WR25_01014 isoform I [Diploscapter pachys]|uniref:Uncharacterized protein n=1 Tax=Diploscapter pachys TaxID=2018661 RepID=A0A2A2KGV5_9BILA|nr:hypothetical protein WR25_01014 isoform A [Diploscapter pachys]PAV73105.1 hypothetical protein WR25_01014 isoform B [Diploscapter pachys]PAV73106.1 hypothetical protein WR25_01014 isoform C [Diploscapter pachys]PAV73107.1 hypothetical protein WR25_01014 isoform D [Diploscapter pachys]PAV73108.1 hypothetical protein WR25_01014 isoform E [Diploscapter pachys]